MEKNEYVILNVKFLMRRFAVNLAGKIEKEKERKRREEKISCLFLIHNSILSILL